MPIETPRQLGALLRDRREKAGLSQTELAARVQASLKWVQRAEHGSPGTAMGKMLQALAAVGVALEAPLTRRTRQGPVVIIPDVNAIIQAAKGNRSVKRSRP